MLTLFTVWRRGPRAGTLEKSGIWRSDRLLEYAILALIDLDSINHKETRRRGVRVKVCLFSPFSSRLSSHPSSGGLSFAQSVLVSKMRAWQAWRQRPGFGILHPRGWTLLLLHFPPRGRQAFWPHPCPWGGALINSSACAISCFLSKLITLARVYSHAIGRWRRLYTGEQRGCWDRARDDHTLW